MDLCEEVLVAMGEETWWWWVGFSDFLKREGEGLRVIEKLRERGG